MKRRISAVLLALGLTVSAFSMGVYAAETETETTEQVTEAATEAATEAKTEEATEAAATEAVSEAATEESTEAATEAETETEAPVSAEDQMKNALSSYMQFFDSLTPGQMDAMNDGSYKDALKAFQKDMQTGMLTETYGEFGANQLYLMTMDSTVNWAGAVMNYQTAASELGKFVEFTSAERTETGIVANAIYEKTGEDTPVSVVYTVDEETKIANFTWNIDYSFGQLMGQAGMNTLMGVGIVFLTLLFLSALIGNLHIIPDMIEKATKKNAPAPAAPAPTPAAAPVVEEELVDDTELVAVIAAAIAAAENTSTDGFVVRSIKKSNKRNWQRA